nr:MAG TPA: Protein of unknown function (DUF1071) [Caudoviricetes sp.]
MENSLFNQLYELDVADKVEQKNGLNYLSWAYAWAEVKKIDEHADYVIERFGDNQLPYVYDENTGYMVFTKMIINGIKHSMWLPVMDNQNKTMLSHEYTYQVKEYENGKWTGGYVEKKVEPATMFDINKTLMRCLVKNIAMFGLGLKLYQGEDLPTVATREEALKVVVSFGKYQGKTLQEIYDTNKNYFEWLRGNAKDENIRVAIDLIDKLPSEEEQNKKLELLATMKSLAIATSTDIEKILETYKVEKSEDMEISQLEQAIRVMKRKEDNHE